MYVLFSNATLYTSHNVSSIGVKSDQLHTKANRTVLRCQEGK